MLLQPHHAAHFQPVSFHELPLQRGRSCQRKHGAEPVGGFGKMKREHVWEQKSDLVKLPISKE